MVLCSKNAWQRYIVLHVQRFFLWPPLLDLLEEVWVTFPDCYTEKFIFMEFSSQNESE